MKAIVFTMFLLLLAGAGVYLFTSLRNVAREVIPREDIPGRDYEIVGWRSDAGGVAYVMIDPSGRIPVTVADGAGRKRAEGPRPSREYMDSVPGNVRAYRIIARKSGDALAYVVAAERLEIEAGFNILKGNVILSIRDPGDSLHDTRQKGP